MGFWSLLEVSSMPMLQVIVIGLLGAFMATDHLDLLSADARKSLNKIVFAVFTPSLCFASLASTVQLKDIISWWFMPVNIGITFLVGGTFGWITMKIIRPKPYLQSLIIAMCATGNLGNILLIIIPAICNESGSPFGEKSVCSSAGFSYVSFSLAIGAFYVWTYAFHLIRRASEQYNAMLLDEEKDKEPCRDSEASEKAPLLAEQVHIVVGSTSGLNDNIQQSRTLGKAVHGVLHQILKELKSPPIFSSVIGFIVGAVPWVRTLIIGDDAPLRVLYDCAKLLGDGTIPCITLILGGNLTQGMRKAQVSVWMAMAVIVVRYVILPVVGIGVVTGASRLGFLPPDPLFHFILMIQFTLPPAMNISTMTQLFEVALEESGVLFLWSYLVAALAMTGWPTVFMWILS